MKDKINLFLSLGIIGGIICLAGDVLLGWFNPVESFGLSNLFPIFSKEWAEVSPVRFVVGGACGVIALILMFPGFYALYEIMKIKCQKLSRIFLIGAALFCSVGILYHCIFAIAAYSYNRLTALGIMEAEIYTWDVFITFLPLALIAVIGFCIVSILLFTVSVCGKMGFPRWIAAFNPCIIMFLSIILSKLLPASRAVNGILGWGQQSIGIIIMFIAYLLMYKKQNAHD